MVTPLIIIAILFTPWLALRLIWGDPHRGGLIGLAVAFAFFGVGHFVSTDGMAEMLPPFVPFRKELVYATGVWEFLLAIGLMIPRFRKLAALLCIMTLVLFFPANIYAAINSIGLGGHQWGPVYLLIRLPLQLLLLFWAWHFGWKEKAA